MSQRISNNPIFVVGMSRYGTSLAEQILSSHHDVFGAGELPILGNLANGVDFKTLYDHSDLLKKIRDPHFAYLDQLEKKYFKNSR